MRKGDRIRLRSGGADMSCERVNYGGTPPFAQCVWQDERRKLHRAYINLDALSRVFTEE